MLNVAAYIYVMRAVVPIIGGILAVIFILAYCFPLQAVIFAVFVALVWLGLWWTRGSVRPTGPAPRQRVEPHFQAALRDQADSPGLSNT